MAYTMADIDTPRMGSTMGREARRVPLDFDWPIGEVWEGYLLPDRLRETECSDCGGRGQTAARQWVEQIAHLALIADDDLDAQARGRDLHPWLRESGSVAWGTRPSADYREFGAGLAGRSGDMGGHDALDRWEATKKLIGAAGLDPEAWGICQACGGHGTLEEYDGQRAEAEAWEPVGPPKGEGWQMWETTSEGSPSSPVFATPEELADYCAANVSIFGNSMASREQWLKIITGEDFAHVQIAPGVIAM